MTIMANKNQQTIAVRQQIECNAKLFDYANKKRMEGQFNDVTIQVGDQNISANRMVLSCFSKYFESMFLSSFKERYQDTVAVKELDGESVSSLIEYIYTGSIDINAGNVMALLSSADFLQMDDITKFCFDYFETTLSVENCLEIFISSVTYNNPRPLNKTLELISNNFDVISEKDTFKGLSKHNLDSLLFELREQNVGEKSMFKAVLNWVKHDEDRKQYFASLFFTFDLSKFSNEFIEDEVADEPLVKENIECINATVERLISKSKEQRKKANAPKILSVGGENCNSTLEIYNIHGTSNVCYPDLPLDYLLHHCLLKLSDIVYCLGGSCCGNDRILDTVSTVFQMNTTDLNRQWKKVNSMALKRCRFGAAVFDKYHFVVAGGWYNKTLNYAEMFDVRTNQWKMIAAMNYVRNDFSLVVVNGRIFAIGGHDRHQLISNNEYLHGLDGKWKEIRPMNTPRCSHAAVSYKDLVYVIGGQNKQSRAENTVEVFDPEKEEWSYIANMNVGRYHHAACVLQEKIFVVGGIDENGKSVKTIECYEPLLKVWITVGCINRVLVGHALVTLNDII